MVFGVRSLYPPSFNRTIVELKRKSVSSSRLQVTAFNRTIVELKHSLTKRGDTMIARF